jgi:hypothetical protein
VERLVGQGGKHRTKIELHRDHREPVASTRAAEQTDGLLLTFSVRWGQLRDLVVGCGAGWRGKDSEAIGRGPSRHSTVEAREVAKVASIVATKNEPRPQGVGVHAPKMRDGARREKDYAILMTLPPNPLGVLLLL